MCVANAVVLFLFFDLFFFVQIQFHYHSFPKYRIWMNAVAQVHAHNIHFMGAQTQTHATWWAWSVESKDERITKNEENDLSFTHIRRLYCVEIISWARVCVRFSDISVRHSRQWCLLRFFFPWGNNALLYGVEMLNDDLMMAERTYS